MSTASGASARHALADTWLEAALAASHGDWELMTPGRTASTSLAVKPSFVGGSSRETRDGNTGSAALT
jgi:hypothetical protein